MPPVIAAIHGILTGQTEPSWPDRFDAWMLERCPMVKVIKKEYSAGPFPRWNCWHRNPELAAGLANEIVLLLGATHDSISPPPWLFAHSNGAHIALLVTKRLIERGCQVGGLILSGAACDPDIATNGVADWCAAGQLGAAIAYCSAGDELLPPVSYPAEAPRWRVLRDKAWARLIRPYGSLGRTGWLFGGRPLCESPAHAGLECERVFNRWFTGGHSGYFDKNTIARTFECVLADIQNSTPRKL